MTHTMTFVDSSCGKRQHVCETRAPQASLEQRAAKHHAYVTRATQLGVSLARDTPEWNEMAWQYFTSGAQDAIAATKPDCSSGRSAQAKMLPTSSHSP